MKPDNIIRIDGPISIVRATESLSLDFPLRPDFLANVVFPRDMTQREAERFCAFVMTLAQPAESATAAEGSEA